jgi:hypothetical protein
MSAPVQTRSLESGTGFSPTAALPPEVAIREWRGFNGYQVLSPFCTGSGETSIQDAEPLAIAR